MHLKRYVSVLVSLAVVLALGACKGGSSSSTVNGGKKATSATLSVGFNARSKTSSRLTNSLFAAAVGTITDVTRITVDVSNGSSLIVNGVPLTNNNGTWTADINELPAGELLTFIGHAYNSSSVEIFTGSTAKALTEADHNVAITMAPVSNNTTMPFLSITQIGRPAEILTGSTAPVSLSVNGNTGDTLTFSVAAAENGGSVSPSTGSLTLNGTLATIVLTYTAPETPGTYVHTVTVTNSQGNSVSTTFDTNVTSQLINDDVTVQFSPVITALVPARSGSTVSFTAYVTDAGPVDQLTYHWSFQCTGNEPNWPYTAYNCSDSYFGDTAAPVAYLNRYDETVAGKLTITVANASGGSTTVSYAVHKSQFPASVVSNIPILPQAAHHVNGLDDCRFGSASGNIVALILDEGGAGTDYNNDGDTNDYVLGYYDVSQNVQVNAGIAIDQDNVAVDGDMLVFQYPENGAIGWYSITNQQVHNTEITPMAFGRSTWSSTRIVSNGKIAFIAALRDLNDDGIPDAELNIYDAAAGQNNPTGVMVASNGYYGQEQFVPSISGDQVAFIGPSMTVEYYTISTGVTVDTRIPHTDAWNAPTIDNGIIVFNTAEGIAYYTIANDKYVLTPLFSASGTGPSLSNGIIAAVVREDAVLGDLNGDGGIDSGPYDYTDGTNRGNGVLVLYDITTGRMVSTGISIICCGPEISGFVIAFDSNPCDQWFVVLDDIVKSYFGR